MHVKNMLKPHTHTIQDLSQCDPPYQALGPNPTAHMPQSSYILTRWHFLLFPEGEAFGLSSSHAVSSALDALSLFSNQRSHTHISKPSFNTTFSVNTSRPQYLDLHSLHTSPFTDTCIQPWCMNYGCRMSLLSILSQLHLYSAYFKFLQSKGCVIYLSFFIPHPLAPRTQWIASLLELLNDDWIDWWHWMKHINIPVP